VNGGVKHKMFAPESSQITTHAGFFFQYTNRKSGPAQQSGGSQSTYSGTNYDYIVIILKFLVSHLSNLRKSNRTRKKNIRAENGNFAAW
jgi:hypothetical protein